MVWTSCHVHGKGPMEIKLAALGMSLRKILPGLRFFCIFEKSGKNEATDLASAVRGSTIAIISAHVLALTCGRVQARARVQVLQNSASQMVVLRFTTLSARDRH